MRRLSQMMDPTTYATQRRNQAETMIGEGKLREGSMWHPYDQQEANDIREQAESDIKSYLQRYKNMQSDFRQMDQIFSTWNSALREIESGNQRIHDNFQDEYSRFEADEANRVAANFAAQLEAEETFGVGWQRRRRSNAIQGAADDLIMNRAIGPRQKFDVLRTQLQGYRDRRNQALKDAYRINKEILAGGLDEVELSELKKNRRKAIAEANHQGSLAEIIENALRQISTKTWEPNLKNLTSLSQFGFNMGENDDSVDIMERYWTKQIDLTREIKLEIQKGVKTEAVYN